MSTLAVFRGYLGVRSEKGTARLSVTTCASRWLLDLRVWASEAMDVLHEAECAEAADSGPASAACRRRCRHRLSALIERGSFFIPDHRPHESGPEEAAAPRVIRHPAVGYLVAAERVLAGAGPHFPGSPVQPAGGRSGSPAGVRLGDRGHSRSANPGRGCHRGAAATRPRRGRRGTLRLEGQGVHGLVTDCRPSPASASAPRSS
jgi:hypothetical protein